MYVESPNYLSHSFSTSLLMTASIQSCLSETCIRNCCGPSRW